MRLSMYVLVSLAMITLALPLKAAEDLDAFENQLVYGTRDDGKAPVTWLFDDESGHTLGGDIQLQCFRHNLMFLRNGEIKLLENETLPKNCQGMRWDQELDDRSGAIGITVTRNNISCRFETKFEEGDLYLTTDCNKNQKRLGQPLSFRYFLSTDNVE